MQPKIDPERAQVDTCLVDQNARGNMVHDYGANIGANLSNPDLTCAVYMTV